MKATPERPNHYRQQGLSSKSWHFIGSVVLLDVLALILGWAFFLIVHGLMYSIIWLAPYWSYARKVFVKFTGLPDTIPLIAKNPLTCWSLVVFAIKAITLILFFILGLWGLFRNGFCGQNFICLAMSN